MFTNNNNPRKKMLFEDPDNKEQNRHGQRFTLADIEKITGISYKTIVKRLATISPVETTNREIYYDSRSALPLIYGSSGNADNDLKRAKTRLAEMQANKTEIETQKLLEQLVDREDLKKDLANKISAFRDKTLNIAMKISGEVTASNDANENYQTINAAYCEALDELEQLLAE